MQPLCSCCITLMAVTSELREIRVFISCISQPSSCSRRGSAGPGQGLRQGHHTHSLMQSIATLARADHEQLVKH